MVTRTSTEQITVLKPTAEPKVEHGALADRPTTINGLKIGLLDNVKVNASLFLDRIEARLREDFEIREVVRRTKPTASRGMPAEIAAAMSDCQLVVTGLGD